MSSLLEQYPEIFSNNKYLKWYESITSKPSNDTYVEKHHIIPKSIIPMVLSSTFPTKLQDRYLEHYCAAGQLIPSAFLWL